MTSANVTRYFVYNKLSGLVGEHSQHAYCKNTITTKLKQHQPAEDFTMRACHPDENETEHWSRRVNLKEYLEGKFKHTFWMSDEEIAKMEDKENKNKLRAASEDLRRHLVSKLYTALNIPDSIWIPFEQALNKCAKR